MNPLNFIDVIKKLYPSKTKKTFFKCVGCGTATITPFKCVGCGTEANQPYINIYGYCRDCWQEKIRKIVTDGSAEIFSKHEAKKKINQLLNDIKTFKQT